MQEEAAAQPEGEGEGAVLPPLNAASYNWLIHAFANATARDGSPMPLPVRSLALLAPASLRLNDWRWVLVRATRRRCWSG